MLPFYFLIFYLFVAKTKIFLKSSLLPQATAAATACWCAAAAAVATEHNVEILFKFNSLYFHCGNEMRSKNNLLSQ